jgi:hypothetical protein
MRRYFVVILSLLSLSLYSQNFHLNGGGAFTYFPDINKRQVLFSGYGLNYSYYFFKKVGIYLGYNHFFPITYYGEVPYGDNSTVPAYIKGGANSEEIGMKMKVFNPDTKKVEITSILGLSFFSHKGIYNTDSYIRQVGYVYEIKNMVNSYFLEVELVFKAGSIPFFISGAYNFVIDQKEPFKEGGYYSVPFSSAVVVKAGISLPVMRGPVPSEIKKIEY